MRYRDLVQFDPIETVIQVREADRRDEAEHLVRTYVISDHMAERLIEVIFPQLQFDRPADNKGLLVVGNYGTGKSHLMSVVSAVAEHGDLADRLGHTEVAAAVRGEIAGRFQVLRTEIGATEMSLRNILCGHLERFLEQRGIEYRFPGMAEVPDSKDLFIEMMHRFGERYPNQGLLLVVDELLEYLRSRRDQELILDLTFLRELGEVSRLTRFRFLGGVQESLFDSPRFQFVADSVRRVRDRFEQVRITRTDVAYVVAERLLHKTAEQRAWVHRYLEQFAPLYPAMAERLDEYTRLFPIHPTYLDVFERITLVEKREALRTLSRAISARLDEEVPESYPGLIAYDDYWRVVQGDPALRSIPEVREVVEKSQVLEERIQAAYTRPVYRPMALRLIHALSVLRLTTGDIYAPLGATPEELRDTLCLYAALPEPDSDFLRGTVEVALKEIIRTVSGQFIAFNPENGQYYLDLKKDIDYEALIAEKARVLSDEQLDRYYFEALKRVMECTDSTYVPGYRIWSHEVAWPGHRVTRPGYLFFGAPNERSTAQPPRDFYLYFIQPFAPPDFEDRQAPDEIFFHLTRRDERFDRLLHTFAGALEMSVISGGTHKQVYLGKADEALGQLQRWLRENVPHSMTVTYQGASRRLAEWAREAPRHQGELSIRELVNAVASAALGASFEDRYPEYPAFRSLREDVTETNRPRMAQEAIRWLAGTRTQAGAAVLDGLELLHDGQVRPRRSRYAGHILALLDRLRPGEVLNRSTLLVSEYPGVERDPRFALEPEWLVVVLLALVYSGDVVVQISGRRIDAGTLDQAARLPLDSLAEFRFVERPRDIPLAAWVAVFEALQLSPGLIRDPERNDVAIETLQREVEAETGRAVRALEILRQGVLLWQEPVLSPETQAALAEALTAYKTFLESLRVFNSPGRLRNLRLGESEIEAQATHRSQLRSLERLVEGLLALQPLAAYLREAEALLPPDHPLRERIATLRADQLRRLRASSGGAESQERQLLQRELESLKGDYVEHYTAAHTRARLDRADDERKKRLLESPPLKRLRRLSAIRLLPEEQLARITADLQGLISCWRLIPSDLHQQAACPHCGFRPAGESGQPNAANLLDRVEADVERVAEGWAQLLLAELDRPNVVENIDFLDPEKKVLLQTFRRTRQLPDVVGDEFVAAVNEALRGVERLSVPFEKLLSALSGDGTPCPPEIFQQRLQQFLAELVAGHDPERVRISIEW